MNTYLLRLVAQAESSKTKGCPFLISSKSVKSIVLPRNLREILAWNKKESEKCLGDIIYLKTFTGLKESKSRLWLWLSSTAIWYRYNYILNRPPIDFWLLEGTSLGWCFIIERRLVSFNAYCRPDLGSIPFQPSNLPLLCTFWRVPKWVGTIFFWWGHCWEVTLLLCLEPPKPLPIPFWGAIPKSGAASCAEMAKISQKCWIPQRGGWQRVFLFLQVNQSVIQWLIWLKMTYMTQNDL